MLPLQILMLPRRIFIAATVSLASLVLAGLFLYVVYAQPLPHERSSGAVRSVSSGTVYLSPSGQAAAAATVIKKEPEREVHIANTGLMLLRGATVISSSPGAIRVSMAWGAADFSWTIETDSGTKFLTSNGQKATLEDIAVGDVITVTGQLTKSGAEPTINADYVRE